VQGQRRLEQGQAQIKTVLETLEAGQKDIRETMATKADIQDLKAEVVKKLNQHDKRIDALEEKEGIPNPYKN
jgi:chromosome segregation ATPase